MEHWLWMASYECRAPNLSTCQPLVFLGFSVLLLSGEAAACIKCANPEEREIAEVTANTPEPKSTTRQMVQKAPAGALGCARCVTAPLWTRSEPGPARTESTGPGWGRHVADCAGSDREPQVRCRNLLILMSVLVPHSGGKFSPE